MSKLVKQMIRVNQSGEIAADYIYKGQLAVFQSPSKTKDLISDMHKQEIHHLNTFNKLIGERRVRPSALIPLWKTLGYTLGYTTALLGKETAMACTEAVETVIGQHYNDQLRELVKTDDTELTKIVKEFRDDELEHLNTAVKEDAKEAKGYPVLSFIIQNGCKAAIWVAKRV